MVTNELTILRHNRLCLQFRSLATNVWRLGEGCLTESSKFAQISMAAFAKPLLCAGRVISTKFNLKK